MDSRRDFIKKAAMLTGGAGLLGVLPPSIQKALAIDPSPGSTYLDAEHVVILMQENRSFDHCYGALRGVRGFNDPRAIQLPNKNLVWLQTNAAGETYTPFRLNIKDTKATWMGSLPHSWSNQVDARNGGKYDKWLIAKQAGHKDYTKMPLTQGFYNREDIPFYYALADAFTVCDQNYCSSLTGTTPNRLFLWTGTVREKQNPEAYANVRNENVDYEKQATWTTFPERLEDHGVSWRIYQNELSLPMGFKGEEDSWLANFTDNPIEWFTQYHVRYATGFQKHLKEQAAQLPNDIAALETQSKTLTPGKEAEKVQKALAEKKGLLEIVNKELKEWNTENFEKLSQREKNLHQKAFTTNIKDPDYHDITTYKYKDGDSEKEVKLPKGDILHQFRNDVKTGKLPTVSWLVAPENFSDHPTSPWYGAWYVSEVIDILTQDPEVWKKTIFILCYDENDGYFDHVPPYVVPNPYKEGTGKVSEGIDSKVEFVTLEQDMKKKKEAKECRESPIGLGFRVPLVIASPWNRGGSVCSEVFDHTSVIRFLEKFTSHKSGKHIEETNISAWRRSICGDLTSAFKPYDGKKITLPAFVKRDAFVEEIHKAKSKGLPNGYKSLTQEEISVINKNPAASPHMPSQEKGTRPACALPYQLYAGGHLSEDKKSFVLSFKSGNDFFGEKSAGAPFIVYAPGRYGDENVKVWNYALKAGDTLEDSYPVEQFENQAVHLRVYGPNGFFREFTGNTRDPAVEVHCGYQTDQNKKPTGNIELTLKNLNKNKITVEIVDNAYQGAAQKKVLSAAGSKEAAAVLVINLQKNHHWYDFSVKVSGNDSLTQRFAGHVETGLESQSDPLMARVIV
jgi:phospholipase C